MEHGAGNKKPEDRGQQIAGSMEQGARDQKSDVGGQRSEVRNHRTARTVHKFRSSIVLRQPPSLKLPP